MNKNIFIFFLLSIFAFQANAQEGTKQLMPSNTNTLYLNIYSSLSGNFAGYDVPTLPSAYTGMDNITYSSSTLAPEYQRLNVYLIAGEKLHLAFKANQGSNFSNVNQITFRIKDPSDNVIALANGAPLASPNAANVNEYKAPESGEVGYLSDWNQAVALPNGVQGTTGSFNSLQYTATTTGNHYIEFQVWTDNTHTNVIRAANWNTGNNAYSDDRIFAVQYFNATVEKTDGSVANGRLWSRFWSMNTTALPNSVPEAVDFYVFVDEGAGKGFVNKVNFDMNPFGFVLLSNSFGVQTTGTDEQKRQSSDNNTIAIDPSPENIAQHKIFLNNPDISIFQDSDAPGPVIKAYLNDAKIYDYDYSRGSTESERSLDLASTLSNLKVSTSCNGGDATFRIESNIAGQAAIFLDINNDGDFTDGVDVNFLANIVVGTNTITWTDMLDGTGAALTGLPITVGATATFLFKASTHFPAFDVEELRKVIAEPIRPFTFNRGTTSSPDNNATIFWDDTELTPTGTSQLSAGATTARNNGSGFVDGNQKMLNTWANSVNLGLPSFSFEVNSTTIIPDNKTVVADNNTICSGGTVTLTVQNATAGVRYELRNTSGSVIESITPETSGNTSFSAITLTTATTYNVYATTPGCTGSEAQMNGGASIPINIESPNTTLSVSAANSSTCISDAVTLTISSAENTVNYQAYLGSTSIGSMATGTGADLTINIPANTLSQGSNEIRIVATNTNGCSAELGNKVTINAANPPSANLTIAPSSICVDSGSPAVITIQNSESGVNYQLRNDADNSNVGAVVAGTGGDITLTSEAITSPITFNIFATGTVCTESTTLSQKINAFPNNLTVDAIIESNQSDSITVTFGESVNITVTGAPNYTWTTRREDNNQEDPTTIVNQSATADLITVTPQIDTWYIVTGQDANGCTRTDSVLVRLESEIYIPSLFSPNADGNNDIFRITARGIVELDLKVFDRAGNLLYETQNIEEATTTGWDGTHNGERQPISMYIWSIEGKFFNGAPVQYEGRNQGKINLVR